VTRPVHLTVNGKERTLAADPDTPLLYLLRNDLGLTGVRFGCGQGLCGACDVLVDGRKVHSCDTPLWSVEGKQVVTVEGVRDGDALHPLQRALIAEQAAQCGYCLSGITISAKALIEANPAPSESEIRAALDANLCRCGTHNRIVRAVQRVVRERQAGSST
jgi:nicotinate dehydrogenase subunit A